MEFHDDLLAINTSPRDEHGKQLDPEEKPAERVLSFNLPLSSQTGEKLGELKHPASVNVSGEVIEFASGYRHQCALCKNFDNALWKRRLHEIECSNSKKDLAELQNLRKLYLEHTDDQLLTMHEAADGDIDMEHLLSQLGICLALTSLYKDVSVVHPAGGCPDYPGPRGEDLSGMFKPRDADAEKHGTSVYDEILRRASHRVARRATGVKLTLGGIVVRKAAASQEAPAPQEAAAPAAPDAPAAQEPPSATTTPQQAAEPPKEPKP